MPDTTYAALATAKADLIRKAISGGYWIAPFETDVLDRAALFSPTTGALQTLPAGWKDLGKLSDNGMNYNRNTSESTVTSFGSTTPSRIDVTADTVTMKIEPQETNLQTISTYFGLDSTADTVTTTPDAGGSISFDKPEVPPLRYYRGIGFGIDFDANGDEIIIARLHPRINVSTYADQNFDKSNNPIMYGFTVTAQMDDTAGFSERTLFGGVGWKNLLTEMGFTLGTGA